MNDFKIGDQIYFTDIVGRRVDIPGASLAYGKRVPYNTGIVIGKKRIAGRAGGKICAPVAQGWAWIVALFNLDGSVSMYRRVSVFDTSAMSAADWQSRQAAIAQYTAPISVPQSVSQGVSTMFDLKQSVEGKCAEFVKSGKNFTAYDVTQAVRQASPGENVPHYGSMSVPGVRDLVREYMGDVKEYGGEVEMLAGGNSAVMYRPTVAVSQVAP